MESIPAETNLCFLQHRDNCMVGINRTRFREAIFVSLPFSSSVSVSLSQESGFTAFYTTIVFDERPRYYMLKIIFYLGTSLTANLDAARGECLAFQVLHSAEILSRLSYRVQGCERNGCSMSFTRVLLDRPTFSRTK